MMVRMVLLILAAILFLLAAVGVKTARVDFGWLGLCAFAVAFVLRA